MWQTKRGVKEEGGDGRGGGEEEDSREGRRGRERRAEERIDTNERKRILQGNRMVNKTAKPSVGLHRLQSSQKKKIRTRWHQDVLRLSAESPSTALDDCQCCLQRCSGI